MRPLGRLTLHARALRCVIYRLAQQGLAATRQAPQNGSGGIDLVVGRRRIAVRAARLRPQQTTVRACGRTYRYRYGAWKWCLHQGGVRRCQPDVWVFVALAVHGASARVRFVLVVPNREIGARRTSVLLMDTPRHRAQGAALYAWVDRWDLLAAEAA